MKRVKGAKQKERERKTKQLSVNHHAVGLFGHVIIKACLRKLVVNRPPWQTCVLGACIAALNANYAMRQPSCIGGREGLRHVHPATYSVRTRKNEQEKSLFRLWPMYRLAHPPLKMQKNPTGEKRGNKVERVRIYRSLLH